MHQFKASIGEDGGVVEEGCRFAGGEFEGIRGLADEAHSAELAALDAAVESIFTLFDDLEMLVKWF